ncbi:hypothetical protein evm_011754 [Chilo suppressalis]|nr:hypothetical protein evm_011754 [Chilo suppressalis]
MMDLLTDSEELFEVNNVSLMEQSLDEESSAIIESITRHPSPDCTINHLDFDCDNQFCPWFIEKDISPPQSVDSTYTGLVYTPQANTPLSSFSEATLQTSRKRKNNPRKDKGNIRRRHVTEWKDNKRKILRNLAKAYKSRDEKKDSISGIVEADMRGRHSNHRKVITEDVIKSPHKKVRVSCGMKDKGDAGLMKLLVAYLSI